MSDELNDQGIATPSDFANFVLEKELGHGGMGGVYLGRDKLLDRKVAIKVMQKSYGEDPEFVKKFQREAQAAAKLNHPSIAQIYSFGQEQGQPYIAMELVSGGSLDKMIEKSPGTLDPVFVMKVGQQIAGGLSLAADAKLVHGDVKPENILFDNDGNAKLVDFGLAAMQSDSNEIWGTPYYISPEKVRRQPIDYRADIYSLGGTLYHAITGVPPFEGEDPTSVVKARFEAPPRKPSEVRPGLPPEIDEIILRMLEVEPARRYPTYTSLLGDINRYLAKAGPAKSAAKKGKKIMIKGKIARPSISAAASDPASTADGAAPVEEPPKKEKSVAMVIGLVIGGLVVGLLLLIGLLWWVIVARTNAELQKNLADNRKSHHAAYVNLTNTVSRARQFEVQVNELCERAIKNVRETSNDIIGKVGKVFPDADTSSLIPPVPDSILSAGKPQAVEAPVVAEAAAEGQAEEEQAAEDAPAADAPAQVQLPPSVLKLQDLWMDAYVCSLAVVRVHREVAKFDAFLRDAEKLVTVPEEYTDIEDKIEWYIQSANALKGLGDQAMEKLTAVKGLKEVSDAQKKPSVIRTKSKNMIETAGRELKRIVDKRAKEQAEEEAKRKAEELKAQKEAAHKELVEKEVAVIDAKYESIKQTLLRHMDCDLAVKQLEATRANDLTTREAKEKCDTYLMGVRWMKGVKDYFAKSCEGFEFKDKTVMTELSPKSLSLSVPAKQGTKKAKARTFNWDEFYMRNPGKLNELFIAFVERGRERKGIGLREWSEHMMGSALILRTLFMDQQSAGKRAEGLVKKAVADFEHCHKYAARVFPDIELGEVKTESSDDDF